MRKKAKRLYDALRFLINRYLRRCKHLYSVTKIKATDEKSIVVNTTCTACKRVVYTPLTNQILNLILLIESLEKEGYKTRNKFTTYNDLKDML